MTQLQMLYSCWLDQDVAPPTIEVFHDPLDKDGTNRTGIYVVKITPNVEITELIPINGLRVKISHPRVARLCTGCFQWHLIKECKNNDA